MWKKLLNKYRPYLVFFVILFVAAGIFLVSGNKGSETAKNTAILEIMQPWQKLTAKMGSASSYVWNSVLSFIYLKQDNDKLNSRINIRSLFISRQFTKLVIGRTPIIASLF